MFDMTQSETTGRTCTLPPPTSEGDAGAIALYVHIPFCETKCPYCDFNTYASIEPLMPAYAAALETEIRLWGHRLGRPRVTTLFFGGGTPSYLPAEDIGSIIGAAGAGFDLSEVREITLESNPGDIGAEKLSSHLDSGVDRLSIGVQSFSDRLLRLLGRRHTADEALDACRLAAECGFENVSIDLMYGLPHQTVEEWRGTLDIAGELAPAHVSMYCLTLEGGTPMERRVRLGELPEPDADLASDMYMMAEEAFPAPAYRHYEISNWAKPGRESLHNMTYWRNKPFLGVGPGAHSYLGGRRFWNIKPPRDYVARLESRADGGRAAAGLSEDLDRDIPVVDRAEAIDRRLEMAETMMMGLRLDTGISTDRFTARFGKAPSTHYAPIISELESAGLVEQHKGAIRLTARGRLLGNEVFSRFFS